MGRYAIYARIGVGIMLIACWGLVGSPLSGIAFFLGLIALSTIRYRISPYRLLGVVEAVLCVGYAFVWLPALLGLWLPVIGLFESKWAEHENELLRRGFEDREQRLKLEASREISATEIRNAARLAEMAERSRIAQDIHDHVGHEISGASIALQTALKLYENDDERAGELLHQCSKRLETASEHLREAVHNLKPARVADTAMLAELCEEFTFCPVEFSTSGDLDGYLHHWDLLVANLKEALTNVSRHSNASLVAVRLSGNSDFIRLQVSDNGTLVSSPSMGLGLTGISDRVRLVGGTLTTNADNGFSMVCVLPKK